jgi:hypothetical protein
MPIICRPLGSIKYKDTDFSKTVEFILISQREMGKGTCLGYLE